MLTRMTVVLAGVETTYGTDPALSAATGGILAWDVDLDIKGEMLERAVMRDSISPLPHAMGLKEVNLKFKTELKGCGAGSTPEIDAILQGAGFNTASHTGTAAIVYSLQSAESNMKSVSFYVFKDGNQHKITGARGNVKLTLEAGKYGIIECDFSGIYNAVSANTIPDLTGLTQNKPPIVYNSSFQIDGFSPVCSKAEIDLGNKIVRRESLNATYGVQGFRLTERKPKLSFDADAVVESSNPFWGDWAGEVVATFGIAVGSTGGNRWVMNGYFEYQSNKYGDKDGVSIYECEAALVSSDATTQNDEFTMILVGTTA